MLLDIAIGLLLAMIALPHSPWGGLLWLSVYTVTFSLVPDLDVMLSRLTGVSPSRHREILHKPLVLLPTVFFVISLFDVSLATIAIVALLLHYVHDSIGIGWGVQWVYPISKDSFSFLYHLPGGTRRMKRRLLYRWPHGRIEALATKYGDPHWFRNIYLRWHPYAIIEASVFLFIVSIWLLAILT